MRFLVLLALLGGLLCSSANAAVEGDPFADSEAFTIMPEETEQPPDILLGGYMEFRNQLTIQDFTKPVSILQRVRLEASGDVGAASFFASTYCEQELAAFTWKGDDHQVWQMRPREIYAEYGTATFSVFAGNKLLRWGTADGVNPLDVINPVDVVDPVSTGRSYTREPVLMTGAEMVLGDWGLEAVFLPIAAVQDIPSYGNPWEPRSLRELREHENDGLLRVQTGNEPDRWLQQVEYGFHISTVLNGWDIEGIFFHGFENLPVWQTRISQQDLSVYPEYKRFTAYGLIFAKGFEKNTLRGEFAYKPSFPCILKGVTDTERFDLFQAVLGWDYDIGGDYYINFQLFGDVYGAGTSNETWLHGLTYALSSDWFKDTLTLGVRGKIHTDGEGAQSELFAEYVFNDDWKLYTGLMVWSGASGSYLGQYSNNDFVYITLRYSF